MDESDLDIRPQDEVCDLSSWPSNSKKQSSAFMHINAFAEATRACNSDLDADQEMVQHCSICGKGFYHVHDLRDHELTHISGASTKCSSSSSNNSSCNVNTNNTSCSNNNSNGNENKNFHFNKSPEAECNGKLGSPCNLCINQEYSMTDNNGKCLSDCDICDEEGTGDGRSRRLLSMDAEGSPDSCHGLTQFDCDLCGERFKLRGSMLRHRQTHITHRPFSCSVCGKMFTLRGNMKKHQAIHEGLKPFHCNVCGRRFGLRGNLRQHQVVHTGVKPYDCTVCGRQFSLRGNMEKHKRIHTY